MARVDNAREGIDRYFGVSKAGSSFSVELRAAVTTFLTMAYVLLVNPKILSKAIVIPGVDVEAQLMTTTALAAAIGTLTMGLVARYPFALAPGMGINAYFTFSVVLGMGVAWQTALGAVLLSGLAFVLLSLVGAREVVLNAIPTSIKTATTAGIGLFLAIIGCENAGLVVDHPATLVTLGDLGHPGVLLSLLGLVTMAVLLTLRVRGAILIGIVLVTAIAVVSGAPVYGGEPFAGLSGGLLKAPAWPRDLVLALDLGSALEMGVLGIVFVFLFVDLFDTAGTLFGLAHRSKLIDADGRIPRAGAAFLSDAVATSCGALLGTSSTTTYIESAAGIEEGGKTGLTAVLVALFFGLCVFLSPLAAMVPTVATAPALIIVGAMMMGAVSEVDWSDYRTSIPVFLTIIAMPLTYSIANGISFGIIAYVLIHGSTGRVRNIHPLLAVVALLLVARYAYLAAG